MSVIGQHVTHVAKYRARATTLAKLSRLSVRAGFMCVVATRRLPSSVFMNSCNFASKI
jgi:hypothetical protein